MTWSGLKPNSDHFSYNSWFYLSWIVYPELNIKNGWKIGITFADEGFMYQTEEKWK